MIVNNQKHLENIIQNVLEFKIPVDLILKNYYKNNKSLGKNSRKLISDLIFLFLRNFEKINTTLQLNNSTSIESYIKCTFYIFNQFNKNLLNKFENKKYLIDLENLLSANKINLITELPSWIIDNIKNNYNINQIIQLGKFLNSQAPLDLRVNTLKTNVNYVINHFKKNKINAEKTKYSPWGIRIKDKISILQNELYLNGLIEIQDEGSQIISYLTKAKQYDLVVDLCAGSGGKTLALGAMMKNKGRIYAFDNSNDKLKNIENRLLKSGLNNVYPSYIQNENDHKILKLKNKANIVLIDTPCSGLGTLRRNPDLKYRQNNENIQKLLITQQKLLKIANNMLKKGGKLIYSTCSILPQENEMQIKNFLYNNKNYIIKPINNLINIKNEIKNDFLSINPVQYNTDGFFLAILEKIT